MHPNQFSLGAWWQIRLFFSCRLLQILHTPRLEVICHTAFYCAPANFDVVKVNSVYIFVFYYVVTNVGLWLQFCSFKQ